MTIRIGSNTLSLNAGRRLAQTTASLSSIFEKLSSGQRINRASDDAAGLAIADSLKGNTRVFGQAIRNVNDGISLFAIADEAITQMKGILMRQRELATQAANGSYSLAQRQALDEERAALEAEYNRVIRTSKFNGRNVFDESDGLLVLQAGYGSGGMLSAAADNTFDLGASPIRVSTDSSGNQAGGSSISPQITPDGRYILFSSDANNLVSGDTNGQSDIFLKDLLTGETRRVSTDSSGNQADGYSNYAQLTPDGRYVVFNSSASNLVSGDTNGTYDVFVKDLLTGETRRVSTDSSGNQANGYSNYAQLTPDGRYVIFVSDANNLVSGDTNGGYDVFVKDLLTGETRRVSTDSSGNQANGSSGSARLTPDGRYVVFWSAANNLVSGDTNGVADIFVKDLLTGETRRVNTDAGGNQTSGAAGSDPQITSDGRYIFFSSAANDLVSGDTNGVSDVFIVANPLAERYSVGLQFGVSLQTQSGAQYMQSYLDQELDKLNGYQGQLGAIQRRLSAAGNVLLSTNENFAAAEGRIRDVDVAEESANLVKTRILQQAASAVLSNANRQPALAVQLLTS